MNQQFAAMAKVGMFATAIVTTFFATNNHLSLTNAGHPPPILYRAKRGSWDFLDKAPEDDSRVGNIPLGIEDLSSYEQFEVRLDVADLVLCYTDSLIESRRADGEMLGTAGLLEIIRGLDVSEPALLIPALLKTVADLNETNLDAADDVTVLLFRPNGKLPRVPLRDKLMAPVRVMRGIIRALGGGPVPIPEISLANLGGAMVDSLGKLWRGRKVR
jgi:sigma-B regulation protein RsbU (phosphoserine phosphatase)